MCLIAVRGGRCLKFVHNQTDKICLKAVKWSGKDLQLVQNKTEQICWAAITNPWGPAIQFVPDEFLTEKMCSEAILWTNCLKLCKYQNEEMCLKAMTKWNNAFEQVLVQTDRICWAALNKNIGNIRCIVKPTEEMLLYVIKKDVSIFEIMAKENQTKNVCLEVIDKSG